MAVELVEDENVYLRIFLEQDGFGMPRYRGSPMTGGSFWGRLVSFAKGLFRTAAPHVSTLINKAHPHVKGMASKAVETAIDSAVDNVSEKLRQVQEGKGRKRIKGRKVVNKKKKRIKKRACSFDSSDNF